MVWPGRHGMLYVMVSGQTMVYSQVGIAWYMTWSGGHSMVYGMAWRAWHDIRYGMLYGMTWRACHGLRYGLAGMA